MCTAKKDKMAKKQLKTIPLTKSAEKVLVLVKLVFNSLYILLVYLLAKETPTKNRISPIVCTEILLHTAHGKALLHATLQRLREFTWHTKNKQQRVPTINKNIPPTAVHAIIPHVLKGFC
jgi:hypothetical protein